SIVIPAMNERITISDFIAWCKEGLAKAGVQGEILTTSAVSSINCPLPSSIREPRCARRKGANESHRVGPRAVVERFSGSVGYTVGRGAWPGRKVLTPFIRVRYLGRWKLKVMPRKVSV